MQRGTLLGHYEILDRLGKGGMGEVWAARDTSLGRSVALKVLPAEMTDSPERLARFELEAKALAALDHPGIVTVHSIESAAVHFPVSDHDAGSTAAPPRELRFITMQLVEGDTLDAAVPADGCAAATFFELAIPLADAVAAAHQQGIVHRDLKPANVLVTSEGRVKVLDFGLAKAAQVLGGTDTGTEVATELAPLTEEGKVVGTVAYMSPEQAQGHAVDQRSDVFSLGIVLYEMATGAQPFAGDGKMSVLSAIIKNPPEPLVQRNPAMPRHLGRIINKCLHKDPARRYQSALGLRNDLESLHQELQSGEVEAYSETAVAAHQAPATASGGTARRALTAALFVLLAAGAVLLGQWLLTPAEVQLTTGSSTQITRATGLELDPALSPDGEMVAYVAGPQGQLRLYVRSVDGGRAIPLTAEFPGNHRVPRWAPDGSRIAFSSRNAIWTVPPLGGVPRQVGTGTDGPIRGLDWSPDGSQLVFAHFDGLYTVPAGGGQAKRLLERDLHSPAWSPDGRWIAFVVGNNDYNYTSNALGNIATSSLWLTPAEGGDPIQLTDLPALDISPAWSADGTLFFVSDRDGSRDAYWMRIDDSGAPAGEPQRLTTALDAHTIALSPDGSRMAYSEFRYGTNVWSLEIPAEGAASVNDATPVTRGEQVIEAMGVSPDGQWLAFDSNLGGNHDIYRVPIGGGEEEQLTHDPAPDYMTAYSPDGSEISFYSMRTGARRVYTMPATGGPATQVTHAAGEHRYPTWSPDGLRLAYSNSDSATATSGLAIVSRDSLGGPWGNETVLTDDTGNRPRWSPDGSLIAYVITRANGTSLMLVDPGGAEPREVLRVEDRAILPAPEFPAWSRDSGTIYYTAFNETGQSSIWSIPVEGGEPRLLVRFDDLTRWAGRREFTTDGARFFFTIGVRESNLWALELLWR